MRPETGRVVSEGMVTGFLGYAAVVAFFAVVNLVAGRPPFHTAAVLGSALFWGVRDSAEAVAGPAPILAYNGIHLFVSLLIGLGAAWLVFQAERHRALWYAVFFIFLAGFIYSMAMMGVFAAEIAHLLPWAHIGFANLCAGIVAGVYLWRAHSRLLGELHASSHAGSPEGEGTFPPPGD
jgi:hypothetical protein